MSKPEQAKLGFVKAIKDATGPTIGLKGCKDFCDALFFRFAHKSSNLVVVESEPLILHVPDGKSFFEVERKLKDDLANLCGGYEVVGREWERQMKLLTLGIGDSSEYKEFTSEFLSYKIYGRSINEIRSEIDGVLSVLSKDQIEKVYKKLTENDNFKDS
jgi:hypothetical protein